MCKTSRRRVSPRLAKFSVSERRCYVVTPRNLCLGAYVPKETKRDEKRRKNSYTRMTSVLPLHTIHSLANSRYDESFHFFFRILPFFSAVQGGLTQRRVTRQTYLYHSSITHSFTSESLDDCIDTKLPWLPVPRNRAKVSRWLER